MPSVPALLPARLIRAWLPLCAILVVALAPATARALVAAPEMNSVTTTIPSRQTAHLYFPSVDISNSFLDTVRFFDVNWTNHAADANFLQLEWQMPDSTQTQVNHKTWSTLTYLTADTTEYTPIIPYMAGPEGSPVYFRVSACKGTVDGSGNVLSITDRSTYAIKTVPFSASAELPFTAPTNFGVNLVSGSDGTLHFHWNDNSNKEEGYQLFVREQSASAYPNDPTLTFLFGNAPPDLSLQGVTQAGKTYFMKLRAERVSGYNQSTPSSYDTSSFTSEVSITMPGTLQAPTNLTATVLSENKLRLTWTNNSTLADGILVQYEANGQTAYTAFPQTLGVTTTVDVPWYPGVPTSFQVVAVQSATLSTSTPIKSAPSNAANITLPFNAPTGLQVTVATDAAGRPVANLVWADNSLVESGFQIGVRPAGTSTSFSFVKTILTPNATSAQLTASNILLPGTAYDFEVAAYDGNTGYQSAPTNIRTATTLDGITSVEYAPATYKQPFTPYKLTASSALSTPVTFDITGLPAGLSYNSASRLVTEITPNAGPQEMGLFLCPMTVTYANGWVDHKTLALRVQPSYPIAAVAATAGVTVFNVNGTGMDGDTITLGGGLGFPSFTLEFDPNADGVSGGNISVGGDNANAVASAINQAAVGAGVSIGVSVNGTQVSVTANTTGASSAVTVTPSNTSDISNISTTPGTDGTPGRAGGAPITPLTIGNRTINLSPVTLPLGEFFADPDTETALRMTTNMGNIDILMQPSLTPATCANFMAYVNSGDYNGTVFHRVSPGFVIQGGGYKPNGTGSDSLPDDFSEVPVRPSPLNEPGIPNIQDTIALAKSSDPNSGTHDFFISLADNRTILDSSANALDSSRLVPNGGFTAFARIAKTATTQATKTAITGLQGSNTYTINLTPSGSSTPISGFNPIGDSGLGAGTFWPLTLNPAPSAMDNTKCVVIQSFTPLANILTYSVSSSTSDVTADIDAQNNLVLTGTTDGGHSVITVQALDLDGNVTSQTFSVTVNASYVPVQITSQPTATSVVKGSDVAFHVAATGSDVITYQWRKNGKDIPGATSADLNLQNVNASSIADYRVVVSNSANLVVSNAAHLTVQLPPSIDTPPVAASVNYNSAATFTVVASGDPTLTYKWYKDDVEIQGATTASYTIPHAKLSDAGGYKVSVTNAISTATSSPVTLTVNRIDSDGDGLFDDQEITMGTLPGNADTDGDGYSDGVETTLGTDPRVAASSPGTQYVVAANDKTAILATLAMKSIPQVTGFSNYLVDNGVTTIPTVTIPAQWMQATEMTNEQFAVVLDIALHQMNAIDIVADGARRYVRYPKSTGQIVCYLAPMPSDPPLAQGTTPPSCEVGADAAGTTFYVAKALARSPVRAVSWFGAYLASAALNANAGYINKCTANFTYDDTKAGYRIPTYATWEWAADGGTARYAYPTGATVSPTLANYGNSGTGAGPKKVASYAPSKLGLSDMAGNVAEWIFDQTTSPATGYVRGGSFASTADLLKNSSREPMLHATLSDKVGLRLVLNEITTPTVTAPADQFVRTGDPVTLTVNASGAAPLTYQWMKNGVALAGKTSASLTIASAQLTDAGNYTVKVTSNGTTWATSTAGGLSVLNAPAVTPSLTVLPNKSATLAVTLSAATATTHLHPFTYQWFKNTLVSGAWTLQDTGVTAAKFVIPVATNSSTGSYVCKVLPPAGSSLPSYSLPFELVVLKAPAVVSGLTSAVAFPAGVVGAYYSVTPFTSLFDTSTDRAPSSFVIKGLPAGLTYDPKTGQIYGYPTKAAQANLTIIASNGVSSVTVPVALTLEVKAPPDAAAGTFVAGVDPQDSLNGGLGGRLDVVCTSAGTYTGKLALGGTSYSFTGHLGASVSNNVVSSVVSSSMAIARAGKTSLLLSFSVDLSNAARVLAGSLSEFIPGSSTLYSTVGIGGWRSLAYQGSTAVGLGRAGYHTLVLDHPAGSSDATLAPLGSSFMTVNVSNTDTATLGGRLADGTAVTGSCVMSTNGDVLVFQSLYGGLGSTYGSVSISGSNHVITLGPGGVAWSKKATKDRNYKDGFAAQSLVLASAGLYTPPSTGATVLGVADNLASNAQLKYDAIPSLSTFSQTFRLTSTNATVFQAGIFNPKSVTCTVVPSTGVFSGTFKTQENPVRTGTYYGVIVPKKGEPSKKAGYGCFTLPQLPVAPVTAATAPILSGAATLLSYP